MTRRKDPGPSARRAAAAAAAAAAMVSFAQGEPTIGAGAPATRYCEAGKCAVLNPHAGAGHIEHDVIHLYTPETLPYPEDAEKRRQHAFYSDLAAAIRDIKSDHDGDVEHKILVHAGEHVFDSIAFREEPKSFTIEAYPGDAFAARLAPASGRCFEFTPWDMPGVGGEYEIRFRNLSIAPATGGQLDVCIRAANVSLSFENTEIALLNHYGTAVEIETDELRLAGASLKGVRYADSANEFSAVGVKVGARARLIVEAGVGGRTTSIAGFNTGLRVSGEAEIGGKNPAAAPGVDSLEATQGAQAQGILKPADPLAAVNFFLNRTALSLERDPMASLAPTSRVAVRNASFALDLLEGATGIEVQAGYDGALNISDTVMSGWERRGVGLRAEAGGPDGAFRPPVILSGVAFNWLDIAIDASAPLQATELKFDKNRAALHLRFPGDVRPAMLIEDSDFIGNDYAIEIGAADAGALEVYGAVADKMERRSSGGADGTNDVRAVSDHSAAPGIGCAFGASKHDRILKRKFERKLNICR